MQLNQIKLELSSRGSSWGNETTKAPVIQSKYIYVHVYMYVNQSNARQMEALKADS